MIRPTFYNIEIDMIGPISRSSQNNNYILTIVNYASELDKE